jgi:CRISPR-associated protein (TIGR02710 family)
MNDLVPEKPRAMLVNVGGDIAPAIHTLNEQQPPFICFFVSPDSKPLIRSKILPALNYEPDHYDWIETPAAQSLLECYRVLAANLPRILDKWGVPPDALAVEYTAGTKPMSVASVLSTIEFTSRYFYVGARDPSGRDRDGIGVVLDGKESTWFQTNPWEELAIRERRDIALLFNHGRFADAQERALRLARVSAPEMRKVYESLAELIEGYALWDRFEYKQAQAKISKALSALQLYVAGRDDPLRTTLDAVAVQVEFLRKLLDKTLDAQRLDALDMLANATRRAQVAQKYDDAVARLYSVLEALARNRLLSQYGIKSGDVNPEQIPEALRADYVRQFSDPREPETGLRMGLQASYHLLAVLGDELGKRYAARESELDQVLLARNQSRLAHGTLPVRPDIYKKMREILMSFADVMEEELPQFPELEL